MSPADLTFPAGVVMGLASSLHCAGMCGGIATALMFALDGSGPRRAQPILIAQAGRIAAYVAAGLVVGAFGTAFAGVLDREIAYRVMQWAAAASLVWIGLSVAGLLPAMAALDRLALPIGARLAGAGLMTGGPLGRVGTPFGAGMLWGLMPCGMVYGALFTAMLTGTPGGGGLLMLGFGIGTLPAVVGTAFGLSALRAQAQRETMRRAVGLVLAGFGVMTLVLSMPGGPLCLTP